MISNGPEERSVKICGRIKLIIRERKNQSIIRINSADNKSNEPEERSVKSVGSVCYKIIIRERKNQIKFRLSSADEKSNVPEERSVKICGICGRIKLIIRGRKIHPWEFVGITGHRGNR